MENHPIPQDITGFEFKLVGDMTLKQFAYVAAGAILAWVIYILPIFVFIKIPLALICVALGVAFAFLPVEGRPLDVMIRNFIKAVFSPTQYLYQKVDREFYSDNAQSPFSIEAKRESLSEMSEKQFKDFLNAIPKGKSKLDQKEMVFFQSLNQYGANTPVQAVPAFVPSHAFVGDQQSPGTGLVTPNAPTLIPKLTPGETDDELKKTAALLEKELQAAKAKEAQQPQVDSKEFLDAHQKVLEFAPWC